MLLLASLPLASLLPASAWAQSGPALHALTYIEVRYGATPQAIALLKQYREASRKEAGNRGVDTAQEAGRRNRFVLVEAWQDQSALEAHRASAATAALRDGLKPLQLSPADQRVLTEFATGTATAATEHALLIVTHVDVTPPRQAETEALLRQLAEASRKDEGSLRYDVLQQAAPRTNHFGIVAAWRSAKAFDAHNEAAQALQFRDRLGPLLGALYDERVYRPLR